MLKPAAVSGFSLALQKKVTHGFVGHGFSRAAQVLRRKGLQPLKDWGMFFALFREFEKRDASSGNRGILSVL